MTNNFILQIEYSFTGSDFETLGLVCVTVLLHILLTPPVFGPVSLSHSSFLGRETTRGFFRKGDGMAVLLILLASLAVAERPNSHRHVALGFHKALEDPVSGKDEKKQDAFSYPKLKQKVQQLEEETQDYSKQVKGPVVDKADIWLQKKRNYEDAANLLSKGMGVERQLLHKLRVEVKNNGTKKLKETEENLKDLEESNNDTNSSNGSNGSNSSGAI